MESTTDETLGAAAETAAEAAADPAVQGDEEHADECGAEPMEGAEGREETEADAQLEEGEAGEAGEAGEGADGMTSAAKHKELDPLHYLQREGEFSSELFKVEVSGISPYTKNGDLKKILDKLKLNHSRVKKGDRWKFFFVTFHNEEERAAAIKVLDGYTVRGSTWSAKNADPTQDPYILKRMERDGGGGPQNKRARIESTLPVDEQIQDKVTQLWRKPYAEQVQEKHAEVRKVFVRIGRELNTVHGEPIPWAKRAVAEHKGIPCPLEEMIPSPLVDHYRNKCEFTIATGADGAEKTIGFLLGAYQEGIISVADTACCKHVPPIANEIRLLFQDFIRQSALPQYDRVGHTGQWRQLTVRTSTLGENMAVLFLSSKGITDDAVRAEADSLRAFIAPRIAAGLQLTSVSIQVDNSHSCTDTQRPAAVPVVGDTHIHETLLGMKFRISPSAFFQVNKPAAEKLLEYIGHFANLTDAREDTTLLDICCGTGTIGILLSKLVKNVIGIEMCVEAVEDAKVNAAINGVENITFYADKAENVTQKVIPTLDPKMKFVGILDPPRSGLHKSVIQTIRRCPQIRTLVYVSCSLPGATPNIIDLCRPESKRTFGKPFKLIKAGSVDLFPHTPHFEVVMLFTRD